MRGYEGTLLGQCRGLLRELSQKMTKIFSLAISCFLCFDVKLIAFDAITNNIRKLPSKRLDTINEYIFQPLKVVTAE